MKSASKPSLEVDPELCRAAEAILHEGESLSSFVEQSLRDQVTRRQLPHEFLARGLTSRNEAQQTGEYFEASSLHAELRVMLTKASRGKAR